MTAPAYHQEVLTTLRQIIRATDLQSKRLMKSSGLTIPQIMVLRAVDAARNVTIRKISDDVSLSQATVTTILNRLQQRGLVARVRSTKDKRVVNTELTEAGRDVLSTSPSLLHENFIRRFDQLSAWEQTLILSSLQRVAAMMDAGDLDAAPMLDVGAADRAVAAVE